MERSLGLSDLGTALALSGACGSGAFMLVFSTIFIPLRKWIASKTEGEPWFWVKLHELLSCPYCTATWLAEMAVLIYRPVLVSIPHVRPGFSYWPLGYLVSVMFVNATAMLWVLIIRKALGK